MDGLGDFLGSSDLTLQETRYGQGDGVEISKILPRRNKLEIETKTIANVDLVPWVKQSTTVAGSNVLKSDIINIVWIRRNFEYDARTCNITKCNQEQLLDHLGLRKVFQLVPDRGFISLQESKQQPMRKQSFALSVSTGFVLAWTYDLIEGRTDAICWGDDIYDPAPRIRNVMQSQQSLTSHPMFLRFVAAVVVLSQSIQDSLKSTREAINQVESRTQHSPFGTTRTAVGSYASLSARMSAEATSLATLERDSTILREILESLTGYQWPHSIQQSQGMEKTIEDLESCVRILVERLNAQELQLRYLLRRANIQLTAVSNVQRVLSYRNQVGINSQSSYSLVSMITRLHAHVSPALQPDH